MKRLQLPRPYWIIFAIGVAPRLLGLGKQPLFLDEAWSWAAARLSPAQILQLSLRDPHPPLYYLLLKGVLVVLPSTEAGLRTLSALCSVAALAAILVFAARWWDVRAAIYAGWFTALSSFDIYYAQEARMYTLLGFLWLLAYILLLEALRGRPRLLIGWGLVNVLMVWTHFYGILAVAVHLTFALGLWAWHHLRLRLSPLPGRWLGVGIALTMAGALPVLFLLWNCRDGGAGGAWVSRPEDLLALFALWSVGLTAARAYFLDGVHLVLPPLATLPLWVWTLVGVLLIGGFTVRGISQGWKSDGTHHWGALLALLLVLAPIAAAFGYASTLDRRVWAFKPFLGAAYLFYLWGGVGLSRIPHALTRRGVVALTLVISLTSLIPYHMTWQKSAAAIAFRSLPPPGEQGLVLLDRVYAAPVAFYYLGPDAEVWGLRADGESGFALAQVFPTDSLPVNFQTMDCGAPALQGVTDVWVYGPAGRIRQEQEHWPSCLTEKHLWLFESGEWTPLNR